MERTPMPLDPTRKPPTLDDLLSHPLAREVIDHGPTDHARLTREATEYAALIVDGCADNGIPLGNIAITNLAAALIDAAYAARAKEDEIVADEIRNGDRYPDGTLLSAWDEWRRMRP